MLDFLRRNAKWVTLAIVLFFVATMFSGTFFLANQKTDHENTIQTTKSNIAMLGNVPILEDRFLTYLGQGYKMLQDQDLGRYGDMQPIESVQLMSFRNALRDSLFLYSAKEENLKVNKRDVQGQIQAALIQLDLKDEKALKAFFKENQKKNPNAITYQEFLNDINQNVLIQKFQEQLFEMYPTTEEDVLNRFSVLDLDRITINVPDESNAKDIQDRVSTLIKQPTMNVVALARLLDSPSQAIGWIGYGDLPIQLERTVFSTDEMHFSNPIVFGKSVIVFFVKEKKDLTRPKDFDLEKVKTQLTQYNQNRVVEDFISEKLMSEDIVIFNNPVAAIYYKTSGDFAKAIAAYNNQVSARPEDPLPHVDLAHLYNAQGNFEMAKEELLRAEVKGRLYPNLDMPIIHVELAHTLLIEMIRNNEFPSNLNRKMSSDLAKSGLRAVLTDLGDYYREPNLPKAIMDQYDKALTLSSTDLRSLKIIKPIFEALNAKSRLKQLDGYLEVIEKASAVAKAAQEKASEKTVTDNIK